MTGSLAGQLTEITLAFDHELGIIELTAVELAGQAWLHEARDPHTGEWISSPADAVGKGIHRYTVPDPARLITTRGNKNPADHPFFRKHPVSAANVVSAYDAADEGTRAQGRRWYSDVHLLAGQIADGDAEKGGILLSTYSPQTSWPVNMMNAARSAERGKAIGPGEGMMVSGDQQAKAQKALGGAGIDELMTTAKTHSFGVLIKNGDDSPDDPYGHVVIDTHALNVAAGGDIRGDEQKKAPIGDARMHEYVADQYREAAHQISERDGKLMKPHQLQAITWLVQQRANQAHDQWLIEHGEPRQRGTAKGRATMVKNAWKRWTKYAQAQGMPLTVGVSTLAAQIAAAQIIELMAGDSIAAQFELAFNPGQLRDAHGRWAREPGGLAGELMHIRVAQPNPITAAEARGDSRPVSHAEYQALAARGRDQLRQLSQRTGTDGLDRHWGEIKDKTWPKVQEPGGGATIDAVTGHPLESDANRFAITVRPKSMAQVRVPEGASEAEFHHAMDTALARFRPELVKTQRYLGVFHDDDEGVIDIDPVLVVDHQHEVETIGAYTRAVGGAYNFADGNGYWPPHVAEGASMANDEGDGDGDGDDTTVHFPGPGAWMTQAAGDGLTDDQLAETEQ